MKLPEIKDKTVSVMALVGGMFSILFGVALGAKDYSLSILFLFVYFLIKEGEEKK